MIARQNERAGAEERTLVEEEQVEEQVVEQS